MFDLNTLALQDVYVLHLEHPVSGEKLYADKEQKKPVTITLHGPASKVHRNAMTALQSKVLRRKAGKKKDVVEVADIEQARQDMNDLLAACSADSENLVLGGKPIKSADDFRSIYNNPAYEWVRQAVDASLGEQGNFVPKSETV
jgi:hypothetical protein